LLNEFITIHKVLKSCSIHTTFVNEISVRCVAVHYNMTFHTAVINSRFVLV